jgi:hypothetical protein
VATDDNNKIHECAVFQHNLTASSLRDPGHQVWFVSPDTEIEREREREREKVEMSTPP